MLAIKLQRGGKKHQPSYRFVVAEKRSKMAAPPVEDLGSYNPFTKAAAINKERISYWITKGAQPTVSVHNLLVAQGVINAPIKAVKMKKASAKTVAEAPAAAPAEAPAVEASKAAAEAPKAPAEDKGPESATETAPTA